MLAGPREGAPGAAAAPARRRDLEPGADGPGQASDAQTSKNVLEASGTSVLTPLVVSVRTMLV
jgi:hypothetical protein